ncbi:M24 family metallopeptidase [Pelagibius sp.]|uniref:M24 family metallopeptidase n=1 Tax=Pelagibius sp. TaxID=1931238 RepID=UPI003BB05F36
MLLNAPRLRQIAQEARLDALIATAPENVTYASGYWALSQWIRRGPQTYVILPTADLSRARVIAATSLIDLLADQDVWVGDIQRFGFFQADRANSLTEPLDIAQARLYDLKADASAMDALKRAISELGLDTARVGMDELGLLPGAWEDIQESFPQATFCKAAEHFRRIRAVKTEEEISRLRQAAQITERSIAAALDVACDGATERDLARAFHAQTVLEDATPVLGCIGFGPRGAMPNVQPSGRPLARNDVIRFDVGGRYQHYRADIARNAVLGDPCTRMRTYHEALHTGVAEALAMIRPGVRASDVFDTAVRAVREAGLTGYKRSHVGHGIGIDGYDLPSLAPDSSDVIEEGMVLCVETPYYELGWCGLQVEDTVVVRAGGIETFMTTDGRLQVLA